QPQQSENEWWPKLENFALTVMIPNRFRWPSDESRSLVPRCSKISVEVQRKEGSCRQGCSWSHPTIRKEARRHRFRSTTLNRRIDRPLSSKVRCATNEGWPTGYA